MDGWMDGLRDGGWLVDKRERRKSCDLETWCEKDVSSLVVVCL